MLVLQQVVHLYRVVNRLGVDACWQQLVFYGHGAKECLDDTCGTQGMPGMSLGRAAGNISAKQRGNGQAFGRIIASSGGAVQVDVVNLVSRKTRHIERLLHRGQRARAFWMRRRHVVGVTRFADTGDGNRVTRCWLFTREQGKARRFGYGDAISLRTKRLAPFGRQKFK